MEYDPSATSNEQKDNKARLEEAKPVGENPQYSLLVWHIDYFLANKFIEGMRTGYDKAKAGDPKAVAAYRAAFGQTSIPSDRVDNVITNLKTGTLPVDPSTKKFTGDQKNALAAVPATPIDMGTHIGVWKEPAQFSAGFHGELHVRIKNFHT